MEDRLGPGRFERRDNAIAVTQINDATFAFLPKVVVMALVLWLCLPWILQEMTGFLGHTFEMMEHVTR